MNTDSLFYSGFIECVKWLIANRAKVEVLDNNGRTPLDIAEVIIDLPLLEEHVSR